MNSIPPQTNSIDHLKGYPSPDLIPEKPGIYSWYFNFHYFNNFLDNREMLYEEIEIISKKLSYPPLAGKLAGELGTEYSAEVKNIDVISLTKDMKESIENLSEVDIYTLIKLFNEFASPLYIGIAKDLRNRYKGHLRDINKARRGELEKNKFGSRIHQMEIDPGNLLFKYIVLDSIERYDIYTLEYIANRLFKPIAGRR